MFKVDATIDLFDKVFSDCRSRKLDWEQIKFKEYSAEDCKRYWEHIQVNRNNS
jgi:hypothetical protein